MAEDDAITTPGAETSLENSAPKSTVFAPSLFEQIERLSPNFESDKEKEKKEEEQIYEAEDLKSFVEFPYDVCSLLTKFKEFELTEEESNRLSKLFLKPFQRTFGKIENMDWFLFGMAMVSISTEKILFYRAHIAELKAQQKNAINRSGT